MIAISSAVTPASGVDSTSLHCPPPDSSKLPGTAQPPGCLVSCGFKACCSLKRAELKLSIPSHPRLSIFKPIPVYVEKHSWSSPETTGDGQSWFLTGRDLRQGGAASLGTPSAVVFLSGVHVLRVHHPPEALSVNELLPSRGTLRAVEILSGLFG